MEYKDRPFQGMRAMCHLRREERMFRIDRILEMRPAAPASSDGGAATPGQSGKRRK
jgi:hypothetical protein